MMRRSLREKLIASGVFALAAITVVVATGIPLRAAGPTAVGLWEQVDENSGKAESWIKISERNGVYEGNIVKIFFKTGQDENWVCSKCEGSDKGAPVLGLTLIKGMQRNGLSYENGTVRDPRDGLGISRFDEGQHGWEEARNARLSWHFTVRPQPSLEPTAGQCTRTAGYVRQSHVQGWRTKETVDSAGLWQQSAARRAAPFSISRTFTAASAKCGGISPPAELHQRQGWAPPQHA